MRLEVLVFMSLFCFSSVYAAEGSKEEFDSETRADIKRWQEMFGPIAFDGHFVWCMKLVNPQPESAFREFASQKQPSWGRIELSSTWVERFFKQESTPALQFRSPMAIPSKYYLAKPGHWTNLLYYEWKKPDYAFTMMESSGAVLVRIRPESEYAPIETAHGLVNIVPMRIFEGTEFGIPGENVGGILEHVINLRGFYNDPKRGKVPYDALHGKSVVDAFRLPIRCGRGTVFTNAPRIVDVRCDLFAWWDNIIGFVSNGEICVLLFKESYTGGIPPARGGPPHNPDWLEELRDNPKNGGTGERKRGAEGGK